MVDVDVERVLGRPVRDLKAERALLKLMGKRVLVTGAAGALGQPFVQRLRDFGVSAIPTDITPEAGPWATSRLDVTNFDEVLRTVTHFKPDVIVNLAASKDAPTGELNPWATINTSVIGTKNLIDVGRKLVHASTCKAIEPCTAYGAGKLASEKLVHSARQTTVRFYNVIDSGGGNVLDHWSAWPADQPLLVMNAERYLMAKQEAVDLLVWACVLPSARYTIHPGERVTPAELAVRAFPGRELEYVARRRGDRYTEPLRGDEVWDSTEAPGVWRIVDFHDDDSDGYTTRRWTT